MTEYLYSLVFTAFSVSFFSFLGYKEERGVRFASGVILLYVVIVPILSFAPSIDLDTLIPSGMEFVTEDGEFSALTVDALEDGIKQAVCEEFSLNSNRVRVTVHGFDFKEMRAERITVVLSGAGIFSNIEKIEKFVTDIGVGECEVDIEI